MEESYKNVLNHGNQVDSPSVVWGIWGDDESKSHSPSPSGNHAPITQSIYDDVKLKCDESFLKNYKSIKNDEIIYYPSSSTDDKGKIDPSAEALLKKKSPLGGSSFHLKSGLSKEVGKDVFDISHHSSVADFVQTRISTGIETGSFLVTNLAAVTRQFEQWKKELPMVEPFYAVKCNPDVTILRLLASLGCSFDCATMGEIDLVLNGLGEELSLGPRGIASTSIVYANPAKMEHMINFAISNNVRMTVFDGEDELQKIAGLPGHKNMKLLLRLTTDDRASICRFSKKFGCPVEEAPKLLEVAKSLGLNISGVSFHVGSGCGDSAAYSTALEHARKVFEAGEALGMPAMDIIDLGGGFPGDTGGYGGPGMPSFQDLAAAIRQGLAEFASKSSRSMDDIRVIAEPGRYFVSASTVIVTKCYSRKGGQNDYQALYVDDGVYGSFNNVVYDHATPVPLRLSDAVKKGTVNVSQPDASDDNTASKQIPTAVFGPTCDGLDQMCSLDKVSLPRVEVGDWLIWENQGAYTHTASFVFNGYTHVPKKSYCYL